MPREAKQPNRGKVMFSINDVARLIDLPEGLEPKYMYVIDDPQFLCLVFEGEELREHPGNRYENCEAPIISHRWAKTTISATAVELGPLDGTYRE